MILSGLMVAAVWVSSLGVAALTVERTYGSDVLVAVFAPSIVLLALRQTTIWWVGSTALVVGWGFSVPMLIAAPGALLLKDLLTIAILGPRRPNGPQPAVRLRWRLCCRREVDRLMRGDFYLRRFEATRALEFYDPPTAGRLEPVFALRRSYAREALGELQTALDAVTACASTEQRPWLGVAFVSDVTLQRSRLLAALGQIDEALEVVAQMDVAGLRVRSRVPIRLIEADLERHMGRLDRAESIISGELRGVRYRGRLMARCLLALAKIQEERGDSEGWLEAAQAAHDTLQTVYFLPALFTGSRFVVHALERRSVDLGAESIAAVLCLSDAILAAGRHGDFDSIVGLPLSAAVEFGSDEGAGWRALMAGNPLQAAETSLVLARYASVSGDHAEEEWHATRAFLALNSARYLLRSQRHRHAWVHTHRAATGCLLRVVARHNSAGLIEVIENARMQGLPQSSPPESGATRAVAPPTSTHDNSVGGDNRDRLRAAGVSAHDPSELPMRAPIGVVATVAKPLTALGRSIGENTAVASLEIAREIAYGAESWWLGTWADGETLFWGLIDGNGATRGGEIDISSGSDATVALDALGQALPLDQAGETTEAYRERMSASPLLASPGAEQRLARQLGEALLPPELRDALASSWRSGVRLRLSVAPAPEISHVPWGLLGIRDETARDTRLMEAADWRLAPSVAVLYEIGSRRTPPSIGGLGLAVLDPTGDREATTSVKPLEGAQSLAGSMPKDCVVLAGTWRDPEPTATIARLSDTLRVMLRDRVAFFACHCAPGRAGHSSASALCLAPTPASTGLLSAHTLLSDDASAPRYPFPSRVVISACDSAGASSAHGGEWLAFGPAVLLAGADIAIATLFPVFDDTSMDQHLIDAVSEQGSRSLADLLLDYQRSALAQWQNSDPSIRTGNSAPLLWAGYAILGRSESDQPRRARTPANLRAAPVVLDASALALLESADWTTATPITTTDIAAAWMWSYADVRLDRLRSIAYTVLFSESTASDVLQQALLTAMRWREARGRAPKATMFSIPAFDVVKEALLRTESAGHSAAMAEDVVEALLSSSTAGRGLLALVGYGKSDVPRRELRPSAWTFAGSKASVGPHEHSALTEQLRELTLL